MYSLTLSFDKDGKINFRFPNSRRLRSIDITGHPQTILINKRSLIDPRFKVDMERNLYIIKHQMMLNMARLQAQDPTIAVLYLRHNGNHVCMVEETATIKYVKE